MISTVQRAPMTSNVRATGQLSPGLGGLGILNISYTPSDFLLTTYKLVTTIIQVAT